MAKYTPGPWRLVSNGTRIAGRKGEGEVAIATERFMNRSEREANALAISLLPELVEALRECLPYVTQKWVETRCDRTAERHERARALLARIDGEQP
jgi:hypothetical protein